MEGDMELAREASDRPVDAVDAADIETMFYRGLNTCADMPAFGARITAFLRDLGFDTFSYVALSSNGGRLQPPKRILTTLPEALVAEYDAKGYHAHDIALDYAFHNRRDVFYSELQTDLKQASFETGAKLINQEIFNLYRSFGYYDFYLIPMRRDDRITLFSVGARDSGQAGMTEKAGAAVQVSVQLAIE